MDALKKAGWQRMTGSPAAAYTSPDNAAVYFQLDRYSVKYGGLLWRYYAERRELPPTDRNIF